MASNSFEHFGESVIFLLDKARETTFAGSMLFPEILKSDLHEVRATIEAYSKTAKLSNQQGPHACGLSMIKNAEAGYRLKVLSGGIESKFNLDRWN
jgi:hypothetical protein